MNDVTAKDPRVMVPPADEQAAGEFNHIVTKGIETANSSMELRAL